jgi:TolB protein
MNSDGSNVHRISYGGGTYASPTWSPRGDYIAFTKIYSGGLAIGVMRPDGSGERLITSGYIVDGATWSPSGRMIMYSRVTKSGNSKIYMIDLTGYSERMISTPKNASDPEWSNSLD